MLMTCNVLMRQPLAAELMLTARYIVDDLRVMSEQRRPFRLTGEFHRAPEEIIHSFLISEIYLFLVAVYLFL